MKPLNEPCNTRLQTPTEEAFNEIEISLKILSEAVERVFHKTSEIRYSRPCDPCPDKEPCVPSSAPLVMRLRDIKTSICRQTDLLNAISSLLI